MSQPAATLYATDPATRFFLIPDGQALPTGALVLRSKETEVRSFYRKASTARGRWSGYSGSVSRRGGSASRAGREAADRARTTSAKGIGAKGPGLTA